MSNENQIDPHDERKAWTEPRLIRLGPDLRYVNSTKIPHAPQEADDHVPPQS